MQPAFIDLATRGESDRYMYGKGTPGVPTYYTNVHELEPSTFGFNKYIRPSFWAPKSPQFIKQCISGFMLVLILIFLIYIKR